MRQKISKRIASHIKIPYMRVTYHPLAFNKLNKVFKPRTIVMVPTNKFSVLNVINTNHKDKIPVENKSRIYQMECQEYDKYYYIY